MGENAVLTPPEFTFRDRVYRFNGDMSTGAMDVIAQIVHDVRKRLFDQFVGNGKGLAAVFEFTLQSADVWFEIQKTGKTALFCAACCAVDYKEIKALAEMFTALPATVAEQVFGFFFNGGIWSRMIFPSFLFTTPAGDLTETTPSDEPSSAPATE